MTQQKAPQPKKGMALEPNDIKRVVDFFAILMQIDRRIRKKKQ
jgi:hypothetical protein